MDYPKANTIDEYISLFPKNVQTALKHMRAIISKAAPKAKEAIKYGIPTYVYEGNLVHFGGFKNHIGFYPGVRKQDDFEGLAKYSGGKGTVQFPLDKPLPAALITRVVKFRVKQNEEKAKSKPRKK